MDMIIAEQSLALCAVCPYCSRHHDVTGYREENGRQIAIVDRRKAPDNCERCTSPMDPKASKEFQNKMAKKEANRYGPGIGRLVTVPEKAGQQAEGSEGDLDDAAE